MASIEVGQPAPSFRLPSGQGRDVSTDDYRGHCNVIVWFTKGMGCPFCRKHMAQILGGYPGFKSLDSEVLEITTTPLKRARIYVDNYNIPFPYLCDPEHRVGREWGLGMRSHSLAWYAKTFIAGAKIEHPHTELDGMGPALGEFPGLLADDDMGFYIVDKVGVVRYSIAGAYVSGAGPRPIPSNEEIVRELQLCQLSA